eukprot:scaffold5549_cov79-Skeletonema_dohrnii-CCMP3373.AAC.6
MSALLDFMYYYAIFDYDRVALNNSTTVSSHDDKKERMSKEDVNLIPEITFYPTIDSETSMARHQHQSSSPPLECPPPPAKRAAMTEAAAATESTLELSPSPSPSPSAAQSTNRAACAICILDYKAGDTLKILPNCHHAFHKDCIVPWLTERSGHCPLCRVTVKVGAKEGGSRHRSRSSGRCVDVSCSIQ